MEVIKRQKWEKLFKRRELVHVDAVKEFYAKLTMSHNRKKDVARSKVRGIEIMFDHLKMASILGILGNNGICEYIKEGESGSDDQFFDAQVDVEEPVTEAPSAPTFSASLGDFTTQQREQTPAGVDPSGPSGHIPESVMNKLQAKFERAYANRFQADLEKTQAENARLLALLHQAQYKLKP
ncbi:hypothetical protein Dimus_028678 [Dionaea muscipula]